jgi:hypothetical protein
MTARAWPAIHALAPLLVATHLALAAAPAGEEAAPRPIVIPIPGLLSNESATLRHSIGEGLGFLTNLFDAELNLLPEYRGARVCWLYHDNYLAAKLLAPTRPDLAARITQTIAGFGATNSGKIEIVFGEAKSPLPFRHFLLTNVTTVAGKTIRTELLTPELMLGWEAYADLRLLAALALAQTQPKVARQHFDAATALWDGQGFDDPATRSLKRYSAYKLALYLLADQRLGARSAARAKVLDRLLAQQNAEGGFVTDYLADGSLSGVANVETTCLSLLALREQDPAAARPIIEHFGNVIVTNTIHWTNAHHRVRGNIILRPGGDLIVEDAILEVANNYSREFNIRWEGGRLRTQRATVGGSKPGGRIAQCNLELADGEWFAAETTVRWCYGIVVGTATTEGRLRATRLHAGESPDSIIMSGKGEATLEDSTFAISLITSLRNGGRGDFVFPINQPVNRVLDSSCIPGVAYRLSLKNVSVPLWFVFFQIAAGGPPAEIILRDCPSLIPSIQAENLRGRFALPCQGLAGNHSIVPLAQTNTAIRIGNLTLRTLDRPAGISTWGVYLWGKETDVTLDGPTSICELMVAQGKAALLGTEGTDDAYSPATTIEVGAFGPGYAEAGGKVAPDAPPTAELRIRNARLGRYDQSGIIGQISAFRNASVLVENTSCSNLRLITQDRGAIRMTNICRQGHFELRQEGGPINVQTNTCN